MTDFARCHECGDAAERRADEMWLDPGLAFHPVAENERILRVIVIRIGPVRRAVAVSVSAQIGAENKMTLSCEGDCGARPCVACLAAARRKNDRAFIHAAKQIGHKRTPVK